MLDWLNRSPAAVSSFPLYLNTDGQHTANLHHHHFSIQCENGSFALDWLRNDTFGRRVVDAKTGMLFPHESVLARNQPEHTRPSRLDFAGGDVGGLAARFLFGISIERSLAVVAGPVAIFCILLFMGFTWRISARSCLRTRRFETTPGWLRCLAADLLLSCVYFVSALP